ncbi:MAG TPA: alpha/beta fold hydrolase [Gemmatimonadetes bacterium]|nr:alpha/beta fold hydrolase [Gemmatimonadota bacterium]
MHYLDEGAGPPVLMVHGNPTWSYYYRHLVLALRDSHRVVVPDHVGCGLSDKPDDNSYPYRLERRVHDLKRLVEHLQLDGKITLVVHDWGGMIGMAWAARHPERIERLVVLNTAAFHLPAGKRVPMSLRLSRSAIGGLLVRGLNLFSRGALRYCATQRRLTKGERSAYLAPYDSWDHRVAVHRFIQDIPLRNTDPGHDIVSEVQAGLEHFQDTPTLLLWGLRDFVFDADYLEEWQRRMPHARTHTYERAGHYILEDARDDVLALVQAFVAEAPMAKPS